MNTQSMNAQESLQQLRSLKLTKFEFGFVLGLEGHEPTPKQQKVLQDIKNRYAHFWATEGENNNAVPPERHDN
jgi:hypothetical protein